MDPSDQARIAHPTIAAVLDEFLAGERERLSARTYRRYEDVIELFTHSLDSYAYNSLPEEEKELFHRLYDAQGEGHREFTEIFGPEYILPNLDEFLDYFMIRKVMAGEDLMRAAGTVTRKLAKWLAKTDHVEQEEAGDASERAARAARDLPAAKSLARLLGKHAETTKLWAETIEDHFTITGVEKDYLRVMDQAGREFGPLRLPANVAKRCPEGWAFSGVIGRRAKDWFLSEVYNVYP